MSARNPDGSDEWPTLQANSRKPLPELIEDAIMSTIADGRYSPGDRLPTEPELASHLEVARSSLRTALQRLQHRGVVEVVRGRGWYVRSTETPDSPTELVAVLDELPYTDRDLFEVRIALESSAASLAALRATEGELDDIDKASAAYQMASSNDAEEMLETDEAFHGAVLRASHNELLEQMYSAIVPQLRKFRRSSYRSREVHTRSAQEHTQVVRFLRRNDEVAARTIMTGHLMNLYLALEDHATSPEPAASLHTYVGIQEGPLWGASPP